MSLRARLKAEAAVLGRIAALGSRAAEMAFFFALALVPLLALTATAALTWLPDRLSRPLADGLLTLFTSPVGFQADPVVAWVEHTRATGWLALGGLLATWASFRFMVTSVAALSSIAGVPPRGFRGWLVSLASAAVLLLVWMAALLALTFATLVAPAMQSTLEDGGWLLAADAIPGDLVASCLAMVVVLLAILLSYRLVPGLRARGPRSWLVAALVTAAWFAVGRAATGALPRFWSGRALYGTLGSFVVFLLWAYANAWLLLLGGLLASGSGARRQDLA